MKPSKLTLPLTTVVILFSIFCFLFSIPVFAEDEASSPSANVNPDVVKENIKKRIQQAVENNQDVLGTKKGPLRGWTGVIESLTNDSITITTEESSRIVSVTDQTTIIRVAPTGNQVESQLEDLAIGNFIVAMGRVDDTEVLNALRIVAEEEAPLPIEKQLFLGMVQEINPDDDNISITPKNQNITFTLNFTKKSSITQKGVDKEISIKDLSPDDLVLAIFSQTNEENNRLDIIRLHLLTEPTTESDMVDQAEE